MTYYLVNSGIIDDEGFDPIDNKLCRSKEEALVKFEKFITKWYKKVGMDFVITPFSETIVLEDDDEIIEEMKQVVREGIAAEHQIVLMHNMLLSTMHPDPPLDASARARDPELDPNTIPTPHPSSLDPTDPETANFDGELLSHVQRHRHQKYCQTCKCKTSKNKRTDRNQTVSTAPGPPAPPARDVRNPQ